MVERSTRAREINFHSKESGKDTDFLIGGIDRAGGQYITVKLFWEKDDMPPQWGLRKVSVIIYDQIDKNHYAYIGPPENAPGVQQGDRNFLDRAKKPIRDEQLEIVRWNTAAEIAKAKNTLLLRENKQMQDREEQAMDTIVGLTNLLREQGNPGDKLLKLKELEKGLEPGDAYRALLAVISQGLLDEAKRLIDKTRRFRSS